MKTHILAAALAAALSPLAASADQPAPPTSPAAPAETVEGVMAIAPFAYATAPNAKTGGAYISLMNSGPADALTGAASDIAARTEIHESLMEGDVMKMRPAGAIDLPHGGELEMNPGGHHIMLMGLKRPLEAGDAIPITLTFASGATLTVETPVKARGDAPDHAGHGHAHHGHADHEQGHAAPKKAD